MSRYTKERVEEHRLRIKSILIRNPRASVLKIQKILENNGSSPLYLCPTYINKQVRKLIKEKNERFKRGHIKKYLAEYEDKLSDLEQGLYKIIEDETSTKMEKMTAKRELRAIANNMLDRLYEAGIIDKKTKDITVNNVFIQLANQIRNDTTINVEKVIKELREVKKQNDENGKGNS